MPAVFRTKTMSEILEPVTQQVNKLLRCQEVSYSTHPTFDISNSVACISKAVDDLVKIGAEICTSIEQKDAAESLISALDRVKVSCQKLILCCEGSRVDNKTLIESARGFLKNTSTLLIIIDDMGISKIVDICQLFMSHLDEAESLRSMKKLIRFAQDLSPTMAHLATAIGKRSKILTHKVHGEILSSCLNNIEALYPILICCLKVHVQTPDDAFIQENRDYLLRRLRNEISDTIKVVKLRSENDYQFEFQFGTETMDDLHMLHTSIEKTTDTWTREIMVNKRGTTESYKIAKQDSNDDNIPSYSCNRSGKNDRLQVQIPNILDLAAELKRRLSDLDGATNKLLQDKLKIFIL